MNNEQTVDDAANAVQAVLDKVTYKPGWRVQINARFARRSDDEIWIFASWGNANERAEGVSFGLSKKILRSLNHTLRHYLLMQLYVALVEYKGPDGADDLICDGVSVGKQIKAIAGI